MIKTLIVESDRKSREQLRQMLGQFSDQLEITGVVKSIDEAFISIEHKSPDLIFLDSELKEESAFEFIEDVDHLGFEFILTSSIEKHAIKAIKLNAVDYLLKPLDKYELKSSVERVIKKLDVPKMKISNNSIPLPDKDGIAYASLNNITRFEADGSYSKVYFKDENEVIVSKHLKYFEKLVYGYQFFRIHQSHLINLLYVKKYVKSDGGHIIMKDGSHVMLSKRNKKDFVAQMMNVHYLN